MDVVCQVWIGHILSLELMDRCMNFSYGRDLGRSGEKNIDGKFYFIFLNVLIL